MQAVLRLSQNSPSLHRALAEADVGELVAVGPAPVGHLREPDDVAAGLGAPHRRDALAAGRARLGDDVVLGAPPVRRHLPAARARVVGRTDRLEQHVGRRHPEPEAQRLVAVVGEEPVVRRSQAARQGQAERLVAGPGDLEEHPALLLHADLAVVDRPRDAGRPEVRRSARPAGTRASGRRRVRGLRAHRPSPWSRASCGQPPGTPPRRRRRRPGGRSSATGCRRGAR